MKKLLLFALLLVAAVGMKAEDKVTARVSGTTLNIALENAIPYCAFQMDIQLPQGISATDVAAVANRLTQTGSDTEIGGTKFIVAHNTLDGNVLRVIAYNLANAEIASAAGDILTITLSGTVEDPTAISVSNVLFVSAGDLSEVVINDATGENGGIMGDVDGNGVVELTDVAKCLNIYLKKDADNGMADVDNNGEVNITDVVVCLNIFLKK